MTDWNDGKELGDEIRVIVVWEDGTPYHGNLGKVNPKDCTAHVVTEDGLNLLAVPWAWIEPAHLSRFPDLEY